MSKPSRIAIVKELGARTPRCMAAHAVRGEGDPELVVVERYPATLGPDVLAVIEQDAKDLVALHHANIASLISTAKLKGDIAVLSEWVDGECLSSVLAGPEKPPLPILIRVVLDVLEALGAVHASGPGRVCGPITSDDVFVGAGGVSRVTRFGLARVGVDLLGERRKAYAAPELASGEQTIRGDVFGAGVLLWECFTGKQPTREPSAAIGAVDTSLRESWARPLGAVIEKACAVDPAKRYATPGEMSSAITSASVIVANRAVVAQHIARAFGERIASRLAKLEPKSDQPLPSLLAPSTTMPPPVVEPPKPAPLPAIASEPAKKPELATTPAKAVPPVVAKAAEKPKADIPSKPRLEDAPSKPKLEDSPSKPKIDAARKSVPDAAAAALARKPVPLPKRIGTIAVVGSTKPQPAPPPATAVVTPAVAMQVPVAATPASATAPAQDAVAIPTTVSKPAAPELMSTEDVDVDIELHSVKPPPVVPSPKNGGAQPPVKAPAPRPPVVAAVPAPAPAVDDEPEPELRSRGPSLMLCFLIGFVAFGGGVAADRYFFAPEPSTLPPLVIAPLAPSASSSAPTQATATVAASTTTMGTSPTTLPDARAAMPTASGASSTSAAPAQTDTAEPTTTTGTTAKPLMPSPVRTITSASASATRYQPLGI